MQRRTGPRRTRFNLESARSYVSTPKLASKITRFSRKSVVKTMTQTKKMSLIFLFLLIFCTIAVSNEESAFFNDTTTFTACESDIYDYLIDGEELWLLPPTVQGRITSNSFNSCHHLTFPALPMSDRDIMTISFIRNNGPPINYTLRVQGLLKHPENFTFKDINSTHIILIWDPPFSWVTPAKITYILSMYYTKTVNLTASSYILQRPPKGLIATLTPWNPVGEGESIFLNLTDSQLGCDQLDDLTLKAVPYYEEGNISVVVYLFSLKEGVKYCLPEIISVIGEDGMQTNSTLLIRNETVQLVIHNVREEQHVTSKLPFFASTVSYSTYRVQSVNRSGMFVECHFLRGTNHSTCFIDVVGDEKPLSGSNRYAFTKPGNYTLRVYDDEAQRNRQKEPAFTLNITISEGDSSSKDNKDGLYAMPLVILILAIAVAIYCLWKKRHQQQDKEEPPTVENDNTSDSQSVHLATDEERSDMVVSNSHRRAPTNALERQSEENHVAIPTDDERGEPQPAHKLLPIDETTQLSPDEDKRVDVEVEGLETLELHPPPVQGN